MLTTPGGTPASISNSPSRSGVSGASSAGFKITVQPVASAGPIFQMHAPSGPFQGMIVADDAHRFLQCVGKILARKRVLDRLAMDRGRHTGIPAQHTENPLPGAASA